MIKLTIPKTPPSVNAYWRKSARGMYISKSGKSWKSLVQVLCLEQGIKPLDGDLVMTARIYRKGRDMDIDNHFKALLDSLQGYAFHDDSQIVELHAYKYMHCKHAKVELEISWVGAK